MLSESKKRVFSRFISLIAISFSIFQMYTVYCYIPTMYLRAIHVWFGFTLIFFTYSLWGKKKQDKFTLTGILAFILIILSLIRGKSNGIRPSILSYILVFIFAIVYEIRLIMLASSNNIYAVFLIPSQTFTYWLTAMIVIPGVIYLIFWILCLIKSSNEE